MQTSRIDPQKLSEHIKAASPWVARVKEEMGHVLVGQEDLVDRLLIGLLCNGHILLEGRARPRQDPRRQGPRRLPARSLRPLPVHPRPAPRRPHRHHDLQPRRKRSFDPKLGPIFTNLILADEINRAPAKVQSALLEAMQERQVTLGDRTYKLPEPFLVLATQNPIDQEGTYQLPEAQLDRFLLKVTVGYPSQDEELEILDRMATSAASSTRPGRSPTPEQVATSRRLVNQIYIDPAVREYIVDLIHATR